MFVSVSSDEKHDSTTSSPHRDATRTLHPDLLPPSYHYVSYNAIIDISLAPISSRVPPCRNYKFIFSRQISRRHCKLEFRIRKRLSYPYHRYLRECSQAPKQKTLAPQRPTIGPESPEAVAPLQEARLLKNNRTSRNKSLDD